MKRTLLEENDIVSFGKHMGKTVLQIFDADPGWLCWLRKQRQDDGATDTFAAPVNEMLDELIRADPYLRKKFAVTTGEGFEYVRAGSTAYASAAGARSRDGRVGRMVVGPVIKIEVQTLNGKPVGEWQHHETGELAFYLYRQRRHQHTRPPIGQAWGVSTLDLRQAQKRSATYVGILMNKKRERWVTPIDDFYGESSFSYYHKNQIPMRGLPLVKFKVRPDLEDKHILKEMRHRPKRSKASAVIS